MPENRENTEKWKVIEIKNKLGLGTHLKPSVRGAKRISLHPRGSAGSILCYLINRIHMGYFHV